MTYKQDAYIISDVGFFINKENMESFDINEVKEVLQEIEKVKHLLTSKYKRLLSWKK